MNKADIKLGSSLVCINSDGWGGQFQVGGIYTVTNVNELTFDLDSMPVSYRFLEDFKVKEENE